MPTIKIGVDPGTTTGLAVVKDGILTEVYSAGIIKAMVAIYTILQDQENDVIIYVENPNQRKFFFSTGKERLQGAGSIKRDYSIWEEFAKETGCKMISVPPASVGSLFDNALTFRKMTGWNGRTSKHTRDATRIVYRFLKK